MLYAAAELLEARRYPVQRFPERAQLLILRRALSRPQRVADIVQESVGGFFALACIQVIVYFPLIICQMLIQPQSYRLAARICRVLVFVAGIVYVVDVVIPFVAGHFARSREFCIVVHESQGAVILHLVLVLLGPELLYALGVAPYLGLNRFGIRPGHVKPACIIRLDEIHLLLQAAVFSLELLYLLCSCLSSIHATVEDTAILVYAYCVLFPHAIVFIHEAVVIIDQSLIVVVELVIFSHIGFCVHIPLHALEPVFRIGDIAAQARELLLVIVELPAPAFQSHFGVSGAQPVIG